MLRVPRGMRPRGRARHPRARHLRRSAGPRPRPRRRPRRRAPRRPARRPARRPRRRRRPRPAAPRPPRSPRPGLASGRCRLRRSRSAQRSGLRGRPRPDLHPGTGPHLRVLRVAGVHRVVRVDGVLRPGGVRGGTDPVVRRLRDPTVFDNLRVGGLPHPGRLHPGADPGLRQLRPPDLHHGLPVGHLHGPGRVRPGADPGRQLRPLLATDLHERLRLGRVRPALGQRLRVPQRDQQPGLQPVPLRAPVVPRRLPVEHLLHVVLHDLQRLPRPIDGPWPKTIRPDPPDGTPHRGTTPSEATTRWPWRESW